MKTRFQIASFNYLSVIVTFILLDQCVQMYLFERLKCIRKVRVIKFIIIMIFKIKYAEKIAQYMVYVIFG